jgi:hypothetical protein
MSIIGMDGIPISSDSNQQNKKQHKVTKAQAGAVVTSELDMAIETWNKAANAQFPDNPEQAHIFESHFEKFEYTEPVKKTSGMFGYTKLSITVTHQGKTVEIYNNGKSFAKENELNNTNAYFPDLIFDCLGFLIASGLMYNLAMSNPNNGIKKPKNATAKTNKPRATAKSKS